ncbi:arabinosyltransferase domain-containing protein [Corynebacterium frankenforstense]|uniref:arabinosyltransferase domain-containing protein n=1 Tax=Corynebacterium frankenforstense TaxID=1230998 RepID=UPI001FE53543|nr:arabinosyltransferase domain-containing protein [Corynebacterium frankenforstense]
MTDPSRSPKNPHPDAPAAESPAAATAASASVRGDHDARRTHTAELPQPERPLAPRWLKTLAAVTGVLAFLCFLAVPFLPVKQTQSTLNWPQDGDLASVNAPLMSYAPEELEATVPVSAVDRLNEDETLLLGTVPPDSEKSGQRGLFVRSVDGDLSVASAGTVFFRLSPEEVDALDDDAALDVKVTEDSATVDVTGQKAGVGALDEDTLTGEEPDEDLRPMVTGVYSEIADTPENAAALTDAGLDVHVEINSRFTSSPTVWKSLAMWLGVALTAVSLWCLWRLDRLDGRGRLPVVRPGSWRPRVLDWIVGGVLVFWHFFGANTADDGYLLTMAREAGPSGYMANYYRWFGVPESPFGTPYYDLLALMTHVSTASAWMRLHALASALIIWFVLSREVLPRLGEAVGARKVALWTVAAVFLAFWLPYDNGTRPEPVIAMGALVTWVSFERAIATRRLLPAAVGLIIATLSLGAGPTGLMAVAAFLVSLPALFRVLFARRAMVGSVLPMLAPFLGAGTAILIAVFADQTLAGVLESTRVRGEIGPSLPWYQEFARYESLFEVGTVDGAFTRRFPMLILFVALAVVVLAVVRWRRIPGTDLGPVLRLVGIVVGAMFFMMFTPTKWTHHFGVYAGIGAALAAVAALAVSQLALRSRRAHTLIVGGFLLLYALALAGDNGWWYVSSFAVPWWDRPVQYHAVFATTIVLLIAILVLAAGVVQALIAEVRGTSPAPKQNAWTRLVAAPIAVLGVVTVAFSVASFAKGFVDQYPAYSVGKGNLNDLRGNTCGLGGDVLVESDTNDAFLTPVDGVALGDSLESGEVRGFDPNAVPSDIAPDDVATGDAGSFAQQASQQQNNAGGDDATSGTTGGERGGEAVGVNGSTQDLPFNLDFRRVPVIGSYTPEGELGGSAMAKTSWYELPAQRSEDKPVLVVSAAGSIEHHDINGELQEGQRLVLEYGTRGADGKVTDTGTVELYDVGLSPTWRNLRLPLDELPESADVVRINARDTSLDEDEWLAFTPPRVPTLEHLSDRLDADAPGMIDWSVGLQFPCQRPFGHYAGVAEIPEFRVSPDGPGKRTLSPVQDYAGGGALGLAETVNWSYELPAYLDGDWQRDWGSLEIYSPRSNSQGDEPRVAQIDHEEITRSGLWKPSEMNIDTQDEEKN